MRRLLPVVLAACGFEHGIAPGDGGTSDGPSDDVSSIDAPGPTADAPPGTFVRRIDLDDARVVGGPHPSFPLLVSLTEPWLKPASGGGDVASNEGHDIWFSAAGSTATKLDHEVELYDATAGTLIAWVRIESLTAGTVLYLHYGDAAITTSQQAVTAVWSGGYQGVFHLSAISDATAKNTPSGAVTSGTVAGRPHEARAFDGSDDYVDLASGTAVDNIFAAGGTVEAWVNATNWGEGGFARIVDKGGNLTGWSLYLYEEMSTLIFLHGATDGPGFGQWYGPAQAMAVGGWHHVAVVYNKDAVANAPTFYVDGMPHAGLVNDAPAGDMISDGSARVLVGNREGLDRTFLGSLDEVRFSSVARSQGWLVTSVNNQSQPSTFYTVSAPL